MVPSERKTAPRGRPGASCIHPTLFQIQLALELAQHPVVDLPLGPKPQQRLALGRKDGSPDLAVLDELAIFLVARGRLALTFGVLGAVPVRLAKLIEQRVVPGPHRIQLIDALRGLLEQPLSRSAFLLHDAGVPAEAK